MEGTELEWLVDQPNATIDQVCEKRCFLSVLLRFKRVQSEPSAVSKDELLDKLRLPWKPLGRNSIGTGLFLCYVNPRCSKTNYLKAKVMLKKLLLAMFAICFTSASRNVYAQAVITERGDNFGPSAYVYPTVLTAGKSVKFVGTVNSFASTADIQDVVQVKIGSRGNITVRQSGAQRAMMRVLQVNSNGTTTPLTTLSTADLSGTLSAGTYQLQLVVNQPTTGFNQVQNKYAVTISR